MKERRERNFRILEFRENKFDIIGDVHGCYDELMELIERLGYEKKDGCYTHPEGRRLISVGDVAVISADMSGSMHSYPTELYSACCSISAASASAALSVCLAAYFCFLRSLIFC